MNILYTRVSSLFQNTERQKIGESQYDLIIEDKCSGTIPFFERQGGIEILKYTDQGVIKKITVHQIDRLGRNLLDILNTVQFFNEKKIPIHFISQGLTTLDENGNEHPISKMIISILGVVSEMERTQIKERTKEGIKIAQLKGVYKGRKTGSKEDTLTFLNKDKNRKALEYLKKGYKSTEISSILGIHINTITKIKKLGLNNN